MKMDINNVLVAQKESILMHKINLFSARIACVTEEEIVRIEMNVYQLFLYCLYYGSSPKMFCLTKVIPAHALTLVNIGAQTVKGRMQLRRLNKLVTSNKHMEALEQCTKIKSLFDIRSLSFSPLKELSDNHREDEISTALLPEDYWSDRAAKTTGDGNCMFNAVSLALFSTEDVSLLLRLLTAVELYDDADYYATHPAMETHFFSALSCLSDKEEMELSRVEAIKREVKLKVSIDNKRSAFICMVALSRILKYVSYLCALNDKNNWYF